MKNKKIQSKYYKKGFTLLVSIIVTGVLLLISFVVANVAFKQLILVYVGAESQQAFYAADSGIECAQYWDTKNSTGISAFSTTTPGNIKCSGQTITTGLPVGSIIGGGGVGNPTSVFTLTFPNGTCVNVQVLKQADQSTKIDARGYNVCGSSLRKFERGITITY